MSEKHPDLFRQQPLERLSSPERLDRMMQVVSPQAWLPLLALGFLGSTGLLWSIFGRIPIAVSGSGVLIQPRRVVRLQSPVAGQLQSIRVKPGDCVAAATDNRSVPPAAVIATIDPLDLKQQHRQQQIKLSELQQQDRSAAALAQQRTQLEDATRQQQRASLQQQLQDARTLSPQLRHQSRVALQQQRSSLQKQLQDARALAPVFADRLQQRQKLYRAGALSRDIVLEADQARRQNQQQIASLQAQIEQIAVSVTQAEQQYLGTLNTISQLEAQLQSLHAQAASLAQATQDASNLRRNQIADVSRGIQQLDRQIQAQSTIASRHRGCILELIAQPGQVIAAGTAIASMAIDEVSDPPATIAFFAVGDGKQIEPGMSVQVTPTTVKRERFGGIIGTVTAVSPLPVSQEGEAIVLGNAELAKSLMGQEPKIEVRVELKPDPTTASGYQWSSSRGPALEITTGTTVQTWVTVEHRAPITFVLPILREWSGV